MQSTNKEKKEQKLNRLRNELWSCSAASNKRQTEIETEINNILKLSQYEE